MSETILPNTKLGHYSIVRKIGAGGMGVVYLARQRGLKRALAVKVLLEKHRDR